jgi:hypothetical protein
MMVIDAVQENRDSIISFVPSAASFVASTADINDSIFDARESRSTGNGSLCCLFSSFSDT